MAFNEDKLVKTAHSKINYTPKQIEELTKCMDPIDGPRYFMENFMYIQHPTKGKQIIKFYPYQYGLLDTYHNYRKSINLISRQMGKCLEMDTIVKVRNKQTGEIMEITFGEFEKLLKKRQ